ncbi:MAG: LysR family transcriptional regulator [Asticcacaulis sp.]|uniref:LysR family transcriptional regulator n=1 Tax=Asticcacaulis sp. TaxID=1872648 RepID=UPI003F7CCCF4
MNPLSAAKAFVRVVELGGFTAAASDLGLPKSSVSQAVAQLEARLQTQLLYRTTRRVQLTHDGAAYYERARDLLSDLDDMDTMFLQTPAALSGSLRVDMPVVLAQNVVIPRLPEFLDAHPALSVELSSTDRRVDVVAEGFDCVLRVGLLSDSALMTRRLGEMRMINVATPAYIAQHGLPQSLDDLKTHRMVHYVSSMGARPYGFEYRDGDTWRTLDMPGRITVNNTLAFQAAMRAGLGLIQCPRTGVADDLRAGRLIEILPQYEAEPLPVSLIWPRRRHQARRVRAFMDWLSAAIGDYLNEASLV